MEEAIKDILEVCKQKDIEYIVIVEACKTLKNDPSISIVKAFIWALLEYS